MVQKENYRTVSKMTALFFGLHALRGIHLRAHQKPKTKKTQKHESSRLLRVS
jgi:hypothetical protein